MLKKIISSSVLTTSILLGCITSSFAEKVPDIYKFVPKEASMSFELSTSKKSWKIFEENQSIKKQNIFKKITDSLSKDEAKEFNTVLLEYLGDHLLISFDDFKMNSNKKDDVSLSAIVELKNKNLNKKLMSLLKKHSVTYKEFKYKNISVYAVNKKNKKQKTEIDFYFSFVDKYVVFSDKKDILEHTIKTFMKESPSLIDSKDFSDLYKKVDEPHQLQMYINMKKILKLVSKDVDIEEMFKAVPELKSNISLFNLNLDSKAFSILSALAMEDTPDLDINYKKINYEKYASYLPKNTLLLNQQGDIEKIITKIKKIFGNLKEKDLKELNDLPKLIKDGCGVDVVDFVDNFKDDMFVSVYNTDETPLFPAVTFMFNVKDKDKASSALKEFKVDLGSLIGEKERGNRSEKEDSQGAEKTDQKPTYLTFGESETYKNTEVFRTQKIDELKDFSVIPAYAFIDNKLFISSHPSGIKAIVDRLESKSPESTLISNEIFEKAKKDFSEEYMNTTFINLKQIIELTAPFLKDLSKKDKSIENTLNKFESIVASHSQDKNYMWGKSLINADFKNMDLKWLFDLSEENTKKTEKRALKTNASTFRMMLEMYAVDNNGNYPKDIKELQKSAKKAKYWKDLKNPYGKANKNILMDYKSFNSKKAGNFKGAVLYQPIYSKVGKKTLCNNYKIYLIDNNGKFVSDNPKQKHFSSRK